MYNVQKMLMRKNPSILDMYISNYSDFSIFKGYESTKIIYFPWIFLALENVFYHIKIPWYFHVCYDIDNPDKTMANHIYTVYIHTQYILYIDVIFY